MSYKPNPIVDNAIALRLLVMLTTPFKEMYAYKTGVIDEKGKYIVPVGKRTQEQKRSLTYLDKLIINVKKVINKTPGGENQLKNVLTAMVLIKESIENKDVDSSDIDLISEEEYQSVMDDPEYDEDRYRFLKTWCDYIKLKEEMGTSAIAGGSTPNNTTQGIAFYDKPLKNRSVITRNKII